MHDKKRMIVIIITVILGLGCLLYLGGMLGQLMENYESWLESGGFGSEITMSAVNWSIFICLRQAFTAKGIKGIIGILLAGGGIFAYVKLHDKFDGKEYDPRGFIKSKNGTYGTASWMSEKEMKSILEVGSVNSTDGVILGEYNGKAVSMPKDTLLNRHIAIFGASGTMKSRAIIRNALFQALKRNESVVITDPKSELYADTAELYRQNG